MSLTGSGLPIGQQAAANSSPVVIASDQVVPVQGGIASGVADSGNPVTIAGVYNTASPVFMNGQRAVAQMDVNGNLKVAVLGGQINVVPVGTLATYSASVNGLTVASSATDVFLIKGSSTKIVKINRMFFSGTQTNVGIIALLLIKRSADNTGGTRATLTAVSHDSSDPGATASVFSYTANPSALGAAVGTIRAQSVSIPGSNSVTSINAGIFELTQPPQKAIVLNNANEYLAINLNGVSINGSSLNITVDWTEE